MRKILLTLLLFLPLTAGAKTIILPKGYIFGFSASFRDSTVYFTDIQILDSVWVNKKHHFLASRENYSYELKNHLDSKGLTNRTNIVVFAKKRKKLEKKYVKMKRMYTNGKRHYDVRFIPESEFRFVTIDLSEEIINAPEPPKKKEKGHGKEKGKGKGQKPPKGGDGRNK